MGFVRGYDAQAKHLGFLRYDRAPRVRHLPVSVDASVVADRRLSHRLAACRTLLGGPDIEQFLAVSGGATQNSAPSAGASGLDFA
jgi:hypothetical protein